MARLPKKVNLPLTQHLINNVMLELADVPPAGVNIFAADHRAGLARKRVRQIVVPTWAVTRPKGPGYTVWYLAHELAHIADFDERDESDHGPNFMKHLRRLCPEEYQHYELGYKPRNAKAAGYT